MSHKIAIVWRGDPVARAAATPENNRYHQIFSELRALGIAADDGVPAYCNALAGIGADEVFDAEALAAELRDALAQQSLAARLSPKVSVAVDATP